MPALKNIRHEQAVQAFLGNGGNQSAAYREVYKGSSKWSEGVVWRRASELFIRGDVQGRVKELQEQLANKEIISKEEIIEDLKIISEVTIKDYIKSFNTRKGTITFKNPKDWTEPMNRACTGIKPTRYGVELTIYGVEYAYTRICKMLGFDAAEKLKVDQTVTVTEQPLFSDDEDDK